MTGLLIASVGDGMTTEVSVGPATGTPFSFVFSASSACLNLPSGPFGTLPRPTFFDSWDLPSLCTPHLRSVLRSGDGACHTIAHVHVHVGWTDARIGL